MTPNKPYLIRAIHEWICDNGLTPHLLVDAEYPGVEVPREYVKDGQIVLNTSPSAVMGFEAGNEQIRFSARFGGQARDLWVPVGAVLAVFARENGEGMGFEPSPPPEPSPPSSPDRPAVAGRPALKVVK